MKFVKYLSKELKANGEPFDFRIAGAKWADGALVDVRDRDETVELVVAGPPNCFGRILTLSATMSSTYSEMVARRSGASDLQKQLDERVAVARNDYAGEGIDVNFPSAVAMRMKMPVRVVWSLEPLMRRRVPAKVSVRRKGGGAGEHGRGCGHRASASPRVWARRRARAPLRVVRDRRRRRRRCRSSRPPPWAPIPTRGCGAPAHSGGPSAGPPLYSRPPTPRALPTAHATGLLASSGAGGQSGGTLFFLHGWDRRSRVK